MGRARVFFVFSPDVSRTYNKLCVFIDLPVLAEIIRSFEMFAAHLARKCNLWTFVCALVDHQVVRFGESS